MYGRTSRKASINTEGVGAAPRNVTRQPLNIGYINSNIRP